MPVSDNFPFACVIVAGNSVLCMSWCIADFSAWKMCGVLRCICGFMRKIGKLLLCREQ